MSEVWDVWRVCVDCYYCAEGLPVVAGEPEPLCLLPGGVAPYGGGALGFSWAPCEGCGSTLGGDRSELILLSEGV